MTEKERKRYDALQDKALKDGLTPAEEREINDLGRKSVAARILLNYNKRQN